MKHHQKRLYNWSPEFRHSHAFVSDESHGQPMAVISNIDAVQMIEENQHVMYHEIEVSLGLPQTVMHLILFEHLVVKKICPKEFCTISQKFKKRFM